MKISDFITELPDPQDIDNYPETAERVVKVLIQFEHGEDILTDIREVDYDIETDTYRIKTEYQ